MPPPLPIHGVRQPDVGKHDSIDPFPFVSEETCDTVSCGSADECRAENAENAH